MRLTRLAAAGVVAVMGLSACGSNKSAAESAFCAGLVSYDKVGTPGPGEPMEATKSFGAAVAEPVKTLIANAPAKLKADVDKVDTGAKTAAAGDAGGADAASEAKTPIEKWAFDNCGFHKISVVAKDYSYSGLPKSIKAGNVAIRFQNDAKQPHIMLWLARQAGDTRAPVDAINAAFASGEPQGLLQADPVGAGPNATGGGTMDLPKGRYTVFCPIPVNGSDTDSHYMHGMHADITVK